MEKEKGREKDAILINLDKKRRLKYNKESYKEILRNLQIPKGSAELVERQLNKLDLRYLSVFLWAGLNWEDPLLHLVKVENMLLHFGNDSDKLKELERAIVQALRIAVKNLEKHSNN
ncbi:MAG: hypothetical protein JSV46_08695 [Candidatus Aminicenantes bacterium]|jgi:hypothetical protein|nr:MAG: hypothetical protein JSV46_08695 [Candidatus Aminicenantes bacterium]